MFEIVPADVDETPGPDELAPAYALRVARDKAASVAERCREAGTVVLAADTVVVAAGQILGKPRDDDDATRMLKTLSGVVHEVLTAVVIRLPGQELSDVVTTRVHLLPLTDAEIAWYIATGEPEGKAGGYAIQGHAARFIDWIEGSWSNVVGLPISAVYGLLKAVEKVGKVD